MDNNKRTERLKELIEFAGFDVYSNYSGRNMFGQTCVGLTTDKSDLATFAELIEATTGDSDDMDIVLQAMRNARTDSLGYDTIVYFPSFEDKYEDED